jgi:EmrB/QacA subfamily drug resistance transporter
MLVLDVTVVVVALPDIAVDLHLGRVGTTWVMTAYTLMFGGLLLFGGRAADLFGARRMALTGIATFTVASLLSGLAVNAETLIACRVGQGVGAALLSPAALSLITTTFRGGERARALGVWSALGGVGSALGVLLGGVLTAGPGWPWVFFLNVPVGIAVLAALPGSVPAQLRHAGRRSVDVPGALLVTLATGALIYGVVNAGEQGWSAPGTWGAFAAAAVLYTKFATFERTVVSPLMDPRILGRRSVAAGAVLMVTATGVLVAGFFLGSFSLQHLHGHDALTTGLLFLPVALATIGGAHIGGRAIARRGPRTVAATGLAVAAAGSAVAAIGPGATALVTGISVGAIGLGGTFVSAFTIGTAHAAPDESGVISGVINTFHELGGAIGVSVVSSVAAASITANHPDAAGFTTGFAVTAIAAAVAAALALVLVTPGRPSGATPHLHQPNRRR